MIDISAGGPIRDFPAELTVTCIYADKYGKDCSTSRFRAVAEPLGFQVPAGSHSPRRLL